MAKKITKENVEESVEALKETAQNTKEIVAEVAKDTTEKVVEEAKKAGSKAKEAKEAAKKASKATKEATTKAAATAKKTVAKEYTKLALKETYIQAFGFEYKESDILDKVEKAFVEQGHRVSSIKELKLYIKPEEKAAYYVINDKFTGYVPL